MTTGQRISQKRKEAELSQEALGAELGVSRQSIYKWESDAALPEIDKLVALSRRFGVTVGWLLGVEEAPEAEQSAADRELTDAQLKMVEEITNRYIAAQPQPKKRKKWPYVLLICAVFLAGWKVLDQFDETTRHYEALQSDIWRIQENTASQISGISDRVEEILKQQNDLTAAYGVEITEITPYQNSGSVSFSVYAVPKTFTDGMTAEFSVDNGHGANIKTVEPVRDQNGQPIDEKFETVLTCELTDTITVSVVFVLPDGSRQTQVLDSYSGLYTQSFPDVTIFVGGSLHSDVEIKDGTAAFGSFEIAVRAGEDVTAMQIGLFKNQKLVAWAEEVPLDTTRWHGFDDCRFFRFAPVSVPLADNDTVEIAAVLTDQYDRQFVYRDDPPSVLDGDGQTLEWVDSFNQDLNPAHWSFS